jgi:hypothetical protein
MAGVAAAVLAGCGGGTAGGTPAATTPAVPTFAAPTQAVVPPHDIAVALNKVLAQAGTELTATSNDLQRSATLDQAAQVMGDHASTYNGLHQTLQALPAFPVAQTQADVNRLSTDLASLSSVISAMLAAEVAQYGQFKAQINAMIPVLSHDVGVVGNELKGY